MRILIVDDEKIIRRSLKSTFQSQGFSVLEISDGAGALKSAVSFRPDLIILDLNLPDMSGFVVIQKIRERSKIPIIVTSDRDVEEDVIKALDAGADDFVVKPLKVGEVLARIRAVMRRLLPECDEAVFKSGKLLFDISKRMITVNGKTVHFTPIEYNILKILVLNAGKVVTHKTLLKEVWNKTEDFEGIAHLLRVMISNLRNKIEVDPKNPTHILTEPSIGYRFQRS